MTPFDYNQHDVNLSGLGEADDHGRRGVAMADRFLCAAGVYNSGRGVWPVLGGRTG
jgi:hypothetical protein